MWVHLCEDKLEFNGGFNKLKKLHKTLQDTTGLYDVGDEMHYLYVHIYRVNQ